MNLAPALRRVVVGALGTTCWFLHADGDRRALVVDPGADAERILEAVADLDVVAVVLTHTHFDHVLAVPELARVVAAPVLAHPADNPVWPSELTSLRATGHWDAGTATGELLARNPALLAPPPSSGLWNGVFAPASHGEVSALRLHGHPPVGRAPVRAARADVGPSRPRPGHHDRRRVSSPGGVANPRMVTIPGERQSA